MRSKTLTLLISAGGIVAIGLLLAYPAFRWSKAVRAASLNEQAERSMELGNYRVAMDDANSAFGLAPDKLEYALLRARAALKYDVRQIYGIWKPVLRYEGTTPEDLIGLIKALEVRGDHQAINGILPLLLARDPANPEARALYLRALRRDFQFETIRQLAREWIDAGSDTWGIHGAYAEALLNYPDPAIRAEGKTHLLALSEEPTELGLEAIRRLFTLPLDEAETRTLVQRLEAHPLATRNDQMRTLAWRYRQEGSIDFATAQARVLEQLDLEDPADRRNYLLWLGQLDRPAIVLEELDDATARSDAELCRLYLNSLIQTHQAGKVVEFTLGNNDDLPLSQASLLILRARALATLGNESELEKALSLAVRVADLKDFPELEEEFARLERWRNLSDLYRTLMESRTTRRFGAGKLIFSHYYLNHETELVSTLEGLELSEFDGDPNLQNFVAYLKLLYEPDAFLAAARTLEDLMAEHPNLYDFRIVLALAHQLKGHGAIVQDLRRYTPNQLSDGQLRHLRVAHRAIWSDANTPEEDRTPVEFEDLLPRERALLLGYL